MRIFSSLIVFFLLVSVPAWAAKPGVTPPSEEELALIIQLDEILLAGKYAETIALTTKYIEDPNSSAEIKGLAYAVRACSYMYGTPRDLLKVEQDARRAMELQPDRHYGFHSLADFYHHTWEFDKAKEYAMIAAEKSISEAAMNRFDRLTADYAALAAANTATELWSEYDANEVAADEKFGKKFLCIRGKVQAIKKNADTGQPEIHMEAERPGASLICYLSVNYDEQRRTSASSLHKGQEVIVIGAQPRFEMNSVHVNPCQLLLVRY